MTGSIYDLGYRRYDGPRLGRRHAVASLVRHSLRSVLGLGRGGRAKILPAICIGMPAIIALLLIGVRALAARGGLDTSQIVPGHEGLYPTISVFTVLFVAAQAPELLGATSATTSSPCTSRAHCDAPTTRWASSWP